MPYTGEKQQKLAMLSSAVTLGFIACGMFFMVTRNMATPFIARIVLASAITGALFWVMGKKLGITRELSTLVFVVLFIVYLGADWILTRPFFAQFGLQIVPLNMVGSSPQTVNSWIWLPVLGVIGYLVYSVSKNDLKRIIGA